MKLNKWFALILGFLVVFGAVALIKVGVPSFRAWVDDKLYDNYNPYLPCEEMPTLAEFDKVFQAHEDKVAELMRLSPNIRIDRQLQMCGDEEKAMFLIFYSSRAERELIEQELGGKSFYGLPAIWRNW